MLTAWASICFLLTLGCDEALGGVVGNEVDAAPFDATSPEDNSDSTGSSDIFDKCTHNAICRMSSLCGLVLVVVAGVCLVVRGKCSSRKDDIATASDTPSLLDGEQAHAVSHYQPHEDMWPGPNEWKRMNVHQRARITAKVVRSTTNVLKGTEAAERAAQLNEWVRSEEGISNDRVEVVKASLDFLLCQMDPSQEAFSADLGKPWPKQSRWRRISNRRKAMVYAEFMKGHITKHGHISKYAKWVKERGYLINRVDLASEEAARTMHNIMNELAVAYSDVAREKVPLLSNGSLGDDDMPMWLEKEAAAGRAEGKKKPRRQTNGIPVLSITAASPGDNAPPPSSMNREDSFSVFAQYVRHSPKLEGLDRTPPSSGRLSPVDVSTNSLHAASQQLDDSQVDLDDTLLFKQDSFRNDVN